MGGRKGKGSGHTPHPGEVRPTRHPLQICNPGLSAATEIESMLIQESIRVGFQLVMWMMTRGNLLRGGRRVGAGEAKHAPSMKTAGMHLVRPYNHNHYMQGAEVLVEIGASKRDTSGGWPRGDTLMAKKSGHEKQPRR